MERIKEDLSHAFRNLPPGTLAGLDGMCDYVFWLHAMRRAEVEVTEEALRTRFQEICKAASSRLAFLAGSGEYTSFNLRYLITQLVEQCEESHAYGRKLERHMARMQQQLEGAEAELVAVQAQHARALESAQRQARDVPLGAGGKGASSLDMGGDGTIAAAFASLIAEVEPGTELPPPAAVAAASAAGGAAGGAPSSFMPPPPPPAASASSSVTVTVAANPTSTSLTSAGLPGPNSGSSFSGGGGGGGGDPGLLLRFQPMIDTPTLSGDMDGSPPHMNGMEAPLALHHIPSRILGAANGNVNGVSAPAAVTSRQLPFQGSLLGLGGSVGAGGIAGVGAGSIGGPAAAASGLSEMRLRLEAVAARPAGLSMAPPGVGLGGTSIANAGQKRPRLSVSWAAEQSQQSQQQQQPQQQQQQQQQPLLGAGMEGARPQAQGWEPWLQGLAQPQQAPLPLQLPLSLQAPHLMPHQGLAAAAAAATGMDARGPSPGPSRSGGTENGGLGFGADGADGDSRGMQG